ncbi:MAG: universal stress protein [Bacteroidia bacterium]
MKQLVIPVDFSPAAVHACHYALGLAGELPATLHLVHCVDKDSAREAATHSLAQLRDELLAAARLADQTVDILTETRTGDPVWELLAYAEAAEADIFLMGLKAHSQFYRLLIGSVASGIIEYSHLPVWVVPPGVHWNRIQRCVFASDFDPGDRHALIKMASFLHPIHPSWHIMHVSDEMQPRHQAELVARLSQHIGDSPELPLPHVEVAQGGNFYQTLKGHIQDTRADLLCLLTHQRNPFAQFFDPSLTEQMMYHMPCPIFVLRG